MKQQPFIWQARVYYEDTDAGGVVYHARYVAFYERARSELLRQHHIEQPELLKQQIAFVVKSMQIDYIAAAKLDELLTIETEIIELKRASLTFQQRIFNQQQRLINQATVLVASVNLEKMKPTALPKSIIAIAESK